MGTDNNSILVYDTPDYSCVALYRDNMKENEGNAVEEIFDENEKLKKRIVKGTIAIKGKHKRATVEKSYIKIDPRG